MSQPYNNSKLQKLNNVSKVPLPIAAIIDISSVCNLKCPLCPTGMGTIKLKSMLMGLEKFKFYLNKLPSVKYLSIYNWGEPFLNPEIFEIIKYAKTKVVAVYIHSNFSIKFSDQDFYKIINSGLDILFVSLDGASQETYSMYKKGGDFDLVYNNLKKLRKIQKESNQISPEITWKFIIHKYNESEIEKAKKMAADIDIKIIFDTIGLAEDMPDVDVSPAINLTERMTYWLPSKKENTKKRYVKKNHSLALLKKLLSPKTKCPLLFKQIVVHSDGHILPCCFTANESSFMGNLNTTSLKKIWNSDKYLYARSLFVSKKNINKVAVVCENCNIYKKCR